MAKEQLMISVDVLEHAGRDWTQVHIYGQELRDEDGSTWCKFTRLECTECDGEGKPHAHYEDVDRYALPRAKRHAQECGAHYKPRAMACLNADRHGTPHVCVSPGCKRSAR